MRNISKFGGKFYAENRNKAVRDYERASRQETTLHIAYRNAQQRQATTTELSNLKSQLDAAIVETAQKFDALNNQPVWIELKRA